MRATIASILLIFAVASAGDDYALGVRAYEEQRFDEACEAFARAERAASKDEVPVLAYDLALAALRAGDLGLAEAAANRAAEAGGLEFVPERDFLKGCVAFARAELAQAQASGPEAEPFAFEIAIAMAEAARREWERAAASRADWPEARRNVERALRKLEELQRLKEASQEPPAEQIPDAPEPKPLPLQEEQPEPQQTEQVEAAPELLAEDLAPDLVRRIFERVRRAEAEKLVLRESEQRASSAVGEKDW